MSLTVKVFLYRNCKQISDDKEPEIRRFGIEESVVTNYDYMERRVMSIFPNLVGYVLRLHWKDSDDDLVAVSSDEELLDAVSTVESSVFKVYAAAYAAGEDAPDSSAGQGEAPLHPGVTCDVCEGPVRGTRFKCMCCADYDLCETCERAGHHRDHVMFRICEPMRGSRNPFMCGFGGLWRGRGGRGCPRRGGGHHRVPHGHHGGPHGHHGRPHPGCPPFNPPTQSAEAQNSAETGEQQSAGGQPSGDAFLWNLGNSVAAMLDPFGIDCKVDVETKDGETKRCGKTESNAGVSMETESQDAPNAAPSAPNAAPSAPSPAPATNESESLGPKNGHIQERGPAVYPSLAAQTNATCQPVLPSGDPYERGLAPHVVRSLQQMKMMGFNNDGGWLSALLATKNGDVDATLESLKPNYDSRMA